MGPIEAQEVNYFHWSIKTPIGAQTVSLIRSKYVIFKDLKTIFG